MYTGGIPIESFQFTDRHLLSPCARGYSLSGQKRSVSSVVVPVCAGVFL